MITQHTITATVAAGASGATADTETIHGEILKISYDVTGNSMDINLDTLGETKAQAIFNYTGNTDATHYPTVQVTDNVGTGKEYASGYPIRVPYVVYGKLRLTLASAAAAETVTMTITVRT